MGEKRHLEPVPSSSSSSEEEENRSSSEEEENVEDRMEEDKVKKTDDETEEEEESASDSDSDSDRPSPSPSASKLKPVSPPPPAKIPGSSSVSHQSAAAKEKGGSRSVEKAKTADQSKASEEDKVNKTDDETEEEESDSDSVSDSDRPSPSSSASKLKAVSPPPPAKIPGSSSVSHQSAAAKKKGGSSFVEKGVAEMGKATEKGRVSEEGKAAAAATPLFQRVWSDEDERALLRGMIEYKARKETEPSADLGDFYKFVKKALHFDASRNQLVAKMKKLKARYRRNAANGKRPVSSKPHEIELFELSECIWKEDPSSMRPLKKTKSEKMMNEHQNEKIEHPVLNALSRYESGLIGKSLMDEMEADWQKLKQDEMDLLARRDALLARNTYDRS